MTFGGYVGAAGLHLDQGAPTLVAPLDDDRAVGDVALSVAVFELDLSEHVNSPSRCAERAQKRMAELRHRAHHRQQYGRGSALLFVLAFEPGHWDQSCRMPRLLGYSGCVWRIATRGGRSRPSWHRPAERFTRWGDRQSGLGCRDIGRVDLFLVKVGLSSVGSCLRSFGPTFCESTATSYENTANSITGQSATSNSMTPSALTPTSGR
jgi:hypothetical protein